MGRELSLRFLLALFLIAGCCMTGAFASVGEEGLNSSSFNAAKTTPTSTAIVPYYPPANGFAGATTRQFLMPGQTIDRFGGSGASRFFSPTGTSEAARALPPGTAGQPLRTFEVVKPFEVDSGTVAPWFSQPGGGTQFRTPVPLETLLKRGILREQ